MTSRSSMANTDDEALANLLMESSQIFKGATVVIMDNIDTMLGEHQHEMAVNGVLRIFSDVITTIMRAHDDPMQSLVDFNKELTQMLIRKTGGANESH
jgi:hypothetical protein